MKNSVLRIESKINSSFGTGFVIDLDSKGSYILTCQHVIDDVEIPFVLGIEAKVVSKSSFIDMAIIYVETLKIEALTLQVNSCSSLDVEVIGFSNFSKAMSQKKYISASLYKKPIELHANDSNKFYNVRKIKADANFNFDRGNSGSPVICKKSGNVIAMISNKEGGKVAYAIDMINLNKIWNDVSLSQNVQILKKDDKTSMSKDIISFLIIISFIVGIYFLMS